MRRKTLFLRSLIKKIKNKKNGKCEELPLFWISERIIRYFGYKYEIKFIHTPFRQRDFIKNKNVQRKYLPWCII